MTLLFLDHRLRFENQGIIRHLGISVALGQKVFFFMLKEDKSHTQLLSFLAGDTICKNHFPFTVLRCLNVKAMLEFLVFCFIFVGEKMYLLAYLVEKYSSIFQCGTKINLSFPQLSQ